MHTPLWVTCVTWVTPVTRAHPPPDKSQPLVFIAFRGSYLNPSSPFTQHHPFVSASPPAPCRLTLPPSPATHHPTPPTCVCPPPPPRPPLPCHHHPSPPTPPLTTPNRERGLPRGCRPWRQSGPAAHQRHSTLRGAPAGSPRRRPPHRQAHRGSRHARRPAIGDPGARATYEVLPAAVTAVCLLPSAQLGHREPGAWD
jgi:hypothetical protein